jgi:hypothetical protein
MQPPTKPTAPETQMLENRDDRPLPPEAVSAADQVPPSILYAERPPATPASEPPLLEYPDPDLDPTPHDADAIDQDIHVDTQPPEDSPVPQPLASSPSNLPRGPVSPPVAPESAPEMEERPTTEPPPALTSPSSERSGPPHGAEIIEISDDEEPTLPAIAAIIEPMEVDEIIETAASELSLDEDETLVAAEIEKGPPKAPLSRQSSQERIDLKGIQFTRRKLQRNQVSVEVPPLPDYARKIKSKKRAPIQEEDEEGLCEVLVWRPRFLTHYSRRGTPSARRLCIF